MKRYLLNILALFLIIYSLYLFYLYIPVIVTWFDLSKLFFEISLLLIPILLIVTAIGIFIRKNWAIVFYWAAVLLAFLAAYVYKINVVITNNNTFLIFKYDYGYCINHAMGKNER